jgi:hypothetical protein
MKHRLRRVGPRSLIDQIWTSTYLLLGLRYEEGQIRDAIEGVLGMEESTTYQAIIRKGELSGAIKELHTSILRHGELKFQLVPNKKALRRLMRIEDLDTLRNLLDKILTTETWEELLGLPERMALA